LFYKLFFVVSVMFVAINAEGVTMGDKNRKERNSFAGLGIPVGTTLLFKKKADVAVVTVDGLNRVRYEEADVAVSTLATKLNGYPSNGFDFFYLDGVKLSKLGQLGKGEPPEQASPQDGVQEPVQAETTLPDSEGAQESGMLPDSEGASDIDPLADQGGDGVPAGQSEDPFNI
jgi:hypothetical protein